VKIATTLLTLLLPSAALASQIHVVPFSPTSATPIEVHYLSSCRARTHSIARDGREIVITALDPQCPAVLPIPIVEKVKLPEVLPIGVYHVTIQEVGGMDFAVRNAGPKPFELHPSAMYPNDGLPVRMSGVRCGKADCSDVTVRVENEPVAITVGDDGAIWFTAPDHEQGLVDVTVQKADFVTISPGALYYFGRQDYLAAYEPILFPVLFAADGAYGSRWRAEATVSNPAPWTVHADYTLHNIGPCIQDCDPPFEPKSFEKFLGAAYPRGTVLWAPRSEASHLAVALRIRDVSRQEVGYGTEVPVVRERDFVHGSNIHLLDVPLDPRYRVKVRIYMIEPVLAPSTGGAVRIRRGTEVLELPFTLTHRQVFAIEPYYAEVDLPQGVAGERVNLDISMPLDAIGWAFASVTNNETQQVTIIAPQ
jgi:hypothetical protein